MIPIEWAPLVALAGFVLLYVSVMVAALEAAS